MRQPQRVIHRRVAAAAAPAPAAAPPAADLYESSVDLYNACLCKDLHTHVYSKQLESWMGLPTPPPAEQTFQTYLNLFCGLKGVKTIVDVRLSHTERTLRTDQDIATLVLDDDAAALPTGELLVIHDVNVLMKFPDWKGFLHRNLANFKYFAIVSCSNPAPSSDHDAERPINLFAPPHSAAVFEHRIYDPITEHFIYIFTAEQLTSVCGK